MMIFIRSKYGGENSGNISYSVWNSILLERLETYLENFIDKKLGFK